MALVNFGSICFPYCIKQNDNGSFVVLNREYEPLGFNNSNSGYSSMELPINTSYHELSLAYSKILKIGDGVHIQNEGKDIFLYDDATNPFYNKKYMKSYFDKLKILADIPTVDFMKMHV